MTHHSTSDGPYPCISPKGHTFGCTCGCFDGHSCFKEYSRISQLEAELEREQTLRLVAEGNRVKAEAENARLRRVAAEDLAHETKVLKERNAEITRLKASLSDRDEALKEAHGLFANIAHPACPSPSNCKKGCDCQLCEVERLGWKIEKMLGIGPTTAERLG